MAKRFPFAFRVPAFLFFLLGPFLSSGFAAGRGLEGTWQGTFDSGLASFRIVLEIERSVDGNFRGALHNIDDGIYGEPLEDLMVKGRNLRAGLATGERLELRWVREHLQGTYRAAHGSYQEAGREYPLMLGRGGNWLVPREEKGRYAYSPPFRRPDGWPVADGREARPGWSGLEEGVDKVIRGEFPRVHAVLAAQGGELVLEEYFYGYRREDRHPVHSITKSVFSLLFGIAADKGWVDPREKLGKAFPRTAGQEVPLASVLSMTSGWGCDDWKDSRSCSWGMVASRDWLKFSLALPDRSEPGVFAYCGACLTPLSGLIQERSGRDVEAMARERLFGPLGIPDVRWMRGPNGVTPPAFGLELRPRDLLKLGQLVLQRGEWKERRILSEEWVAEALRIRVPKEKVNGKAGYGYLWWARDVEVKGRKFRVNYAWGVGGQYLLVVPELELVVLVLGGNYKDGKLGANGFRLFEEYLLPAFL